MSSMCCNMKPLRKISRHWYPPFAATLILVLCAGCATVPPACENSSRQALRAIPEACAGPLRPDQAVVAAFFAANGICLSPSQIKEIIPDSAGQGDLDREAIRHIAQENHRRLMVVKADERFLWEELGNNLPLLILLPPGIRYSPAATPLIPLAWDREKGTIELLDGTGEIRSFPEAAFFARRDPLKHAALCLTRPGGRRHYEPAREQKLLLADFWYDPGFYRRTEVRYTAIQDESFTGIADVDELIGRGSLLVRKGRYSQAIPVFRAALALDPDNPRILNNLAYTMLNGRGELLTALRHANAANQLDPGNPLILETLGSINLRIGDPQSAVRCLEQAWARALRRSPEIQIAIMDQLVRAWLAADRQDLAWQVAEYRHRTFPDYRFSQDILYHFPALRRARLLSGQNIVPEGG
jgi:tetratricopeptide (TPR) repeat protein